MATIKISSNTNTHHSNNINLLLHRHPTILGPADPGECVPVQEAAPAMATAAGVDGSAAELMLDLSAARHAWLAKDAVLLLLKSGQMVLAHLTIEAGMVKRIKVSLPRFSPSSAPHPPSASHPPSLPPLTPLSRRPPSPCLLFLSSSPFLLFFSLFASCAAALTGPRGADCDDKQ